MSSLRAGVVVTGTEVLSGIIADRNGPWLAEQLRGHGVDLAYVVVAGDRAEDLTAALRFLRDAGCSLIFTSGGLGPTADDMTASVVASFAGVPMVLDEALEQRITAIIHGFASRVPGWDPAAFVEGTRKQATIPEGSFVLEPVGTAPGVVVAGAPVVVVLPGPPRELQPMFPVAMRSPAVAALLDGRPALEQRIIRMFGIPESELAVALREFASSGVSMEGLEITTCLRRGEIEIATVFSPSSADTYRGFEEAVASRFSSVLFSLDGTTIDALVASLLREHGLTIATAESCTGGLLAGRLTDLAGSSAYVLGGVVAYSNDAKTGLVDVPASLIASRGAVSEEVAVALADGARSRFGSSLGVGITGVAGPGGGTPEKPVGTVCFSVTSSSGESVTRTLQLPGDRVLVRERSVTVAMHMIREVVLSGG